MQLNHAQPDGFVGFLEDAHRSVLLEAEKLEETLNHLRFEGKVSVGRNLDHLRSSLDFFQGDLLNHMELEEEVLFPFIESHVPKLESVIHLLTSEHDDFRKNCEDLKLFLSSYSDSVSETNRSKMAQKIQETATYLVYLIKNHIRAESKSVYQTATAELRPHEKKDLEKAISAFVNKVKKESSC